ncbi:MAG: YkgJ family cysteine cluster protein [Thermodesulfobacteriota bacterium]|nr:YkgJ family cysteine cluster protein [Thermodesulfobacteriota bacterium]
MTWQESLEDFGEEIGPGSRFRFECHPGLSCFGTCCATDVPLTPFDIARMRRHMGVDTHLFLSTYCETYVDPLTGFPCVVLRRGQDGRCVLLGSHGCRVYESRPSCCRYYPLARVVEEDGKKGGRTATYYLQRKVDYCKGLGSGPQWTIEAFCEQNGLGPYEKANEIFLQIPFAFEAIPLRLRHDKEVQTMIYQAVFDFDRFFEKYAPAGLSRPPEDDHHMIECLSTITLNLIRRTADLQSGE